MMRWSRGGVVAWGLVGVVLLIGGGNAEVRAQGEAAPAGPAGGAVKKVAEDFTGQLWKAAQWNKASGKFALDEGKAPNASTAKSLRIEVGFSGGGFENFTASPEQPLYIPGDVKKITLRVKRSDKRFPVSMGFVDGWGRGQVNGKYLGWDPRLEETDDWQTVTFDVPADWVRPVGISGVTTHNFNAQNERTSATFWVDDIEAETDISGVDTATGALKTWSAEPNPPDKDKALKSQPPTPLVRVAVSTPEVCNVFSTTEPRVSVQVRNWKPGSLSGKASFSVTDDTGAKLKEWEEPLTVESGAVFQYPIPAKRYGLYHLTAKVSLSDGTTVDKTLSIARVPPEKELTPEQKTAWRYGINYHGGGERVFEAFRKAGIVWFRDYAFGLGQMRLAKGSDRKYAGWPFYPSIMRDYERLGLMVLPVLHAIEPPVLKDGKVVKMGPDRQWVMDMADILITFPSVKYWELDNEYDLPFKGHAKLEWQINWENYKAYHRKFGELVALLGDGQVTAVEQGRAGIYPVLQEACVKEGVFDQIAVLNTHHYTGVEPPEINGENYNRGLDVGGGQVAGFLYDALRATKRAASADGKPRQAWMTEIGWDTLKGPFVSNELQAAYLQRVFMLSFAAGIDKVFWFYNFDAEKPTLWFDGCGLFTFDKQPKLSLPAMAGLTAILPEPSFVGTIEAGPNTAGYVFENGGKLVAGLWAIEGTGPEVDFKSGQLADAFANKLKGTKAKLSVFPTYAIGINKTDPLYLQTAYSLESPYMILAAAGDPAEAVIRVKNNRSQPISGQVKATLPAGWSMANPEAAYSVPAGATQDIPMPFVVGPEAVLGPKDMAFRFTEGGKDIKTIPLRVMVQIPFRIEVAVLEGKPGKTALEVQVENKSARPQSGKVRLKLPAAWEAVTPEVAVNDLKPGERRVVPTELVWNSEWKTGESATVVFESASGVVTEAPIIPTQYRLAKAGSIKIDGQLEDWSAGQQLPEWMLGSTLGKPQAKMSFAWAPEGLYGAVEVQDSKGWVEDPKTFWAGDVLEVFITSNADKRDESFRKGDHQFWFVPMFKENRVYAGRWKVKDEIESTRYDLEGVKGVARRTDDGYVMEFLLPASAFESYGLRPGANVALNANLSIRGKQFDREVYWPRSKVVGVNTQPNLWGTLKVAE